MSDLVTGLFDTESAAESAVSRLKSNGYTQNEITIIMKDRDAAREVAHDSGARSLAGVDMLYSVPDAAAPGMFLKRVE